MKIQISLHTTDYRGDHSADIVIAHDVKENETVEQLVERLLFNGSNPIFLDHVELRVIAEAE